MRPKSLFATPILFFGLILSQLSYAETSPNSEFSAKIKIEQTDSGFPRYQVRTETTPLTYREKEEAGTHFFATLVLDILDDDVNILYDGEHLIPKRGATSSFLNLKIPVKAEKNLIVLTSIDAEGEIKHLKLSVIYSDFSKLADLKNPRPPSEPANAKVSSTATSMGKRDSEKKLTASVSIGVSAINYQETKTGGVTLSELAPTLKVSTTLKISKSFNLNLNGFYNLIAFGGDNAGNTIRFLGSNLRLGYVIPFIKEPWTLTLSAGIYMNMAFASASTFGYQPFYLLNFAPTLKRQFTAKDAGTLYVKYTPAGSNFSLINFDELEIATGIGYLRTLSNGHPLMANLDYSYFSIIPSSNTPSVKFITNTLSLSVGYGF